MPALAAAESELARGGLVAYPTETQWGLGADATRGEAVERLRAFKGRPEGAALSLLVTGEDALTALGIELSEPARRLVDGCWPGPLTLVLPCRVGLAPGIAREDGAVGLRCSPHPLAAELARHLARAGIGPITATSLNRSGEAPARTRREAEQVCADGPAPRPCLIEGAQDAGAGPPSTVLDLCGPVPRVLRWGALGPEDLAEHLDRWETA